MSNLSNQRVAYFNGSIVPESEVRVSFRDRGFKYGDAVFDMTRTFGHRVFKLKEHIDRFYNSLRYVRIDPGMGPGEMIRLSEEVLERNMHLLGPDDDYWLGQRVSRGVDAAPGETKEREGATVIIECSPLPLKGGHGSIATASTWSCRRPGARRRNRSARGPRPTTTST